MKIFNYKKLVGGDGSADLHNSIFSFVIREFTVVNCYMIGVTFPNKKRFGIHFFKHGALKYWRMERQLQ